MEAIKKNKRVFTENAFKAIQVLFATTCLFLSCNTNSSNPLPSENEINEIVRTLFEYTDVIPNSNFETLVKDEEYSGCQNIDTAAVRIDLCPINIKKYSSDNLEIPDPPNLKQVSMYFSELMELNIDGNPFFSVEDSAYIELQAETNTSFILSDSLQKLLPKITTLDKEISKTKSNILHVQTSIPVLSKNQNKAFITMALFNRKVDSFCNYFLLERRNGSWRVIASGTLWIE